MWWLQAGWCSSSHPIDSTTLYILHGLYPGKTVTNRPVRGADEALWEVPSIPRPYDVVHPDEN